MTVHTGPRAKPWEETPPSSIRLNGRAVTIYLYRAEYEAARLKAEESGISLSRWVQACVRESTPEMWAVSADTQRVMSVRLATLDNECQRLRAEVIRLRREAQPEVRIGQRGTKGDIYFSVPEFVITRAIEWGRTYVQALDRELTRTKVAHVRSGLPKEIGLHQGTLDIYEGMAAAYTARKSAPVS